MLNLGPHLRLSQTLTSKVKACEICWVLAHLLQRLRPKNSQDLCKYCKGHIRHHKTLRSSSQSQSISCVHHRSSRDSTRLSMPQDRSLRISMVSLHTLHPLNMQLRCRWVLLPSNHLMLVLPCNKCLTIEDHHTTDRQ